MTDKFYSQFGEDRLLAQIFKEVRNGNCVEVGANDGVNDSTTYYFERAGWDCILVEANPELCPIIRETRRARLFECAASAQIGEAVLSIADGPGRAHGVSSLGDGPSTRTRIADFGFMPRSVTVPTRTLNDILKEAQVNGQIHFVTIDVEGHEPDVLRGFSLQEWNPTILIIEDNSNFKDRTVANYLRQFDYLPFRRTGVNDWYAHRSNQQLISSASLASWRVAAMRARLRSMIKSIPGVKQVATMLRGRRY